MKKLILTTCFLASSFAIAAKDNLAYGVLYRSLNPGEMSMLSVTNPGGNGNFQSIVICVQHLLTSHQLLSQSNAGGLILLPGSELSFKVDKNSRYADGSSINADIVTIKCESEVKK